MPDERTRPLIGIQRAHVELYIRGLGERGLMDSSDLRVGQAASRDRPFRDLPAGSSIPPMGDRDDFLHWFNTTWRAAEDALHDGDARPRLQTWSERAPVTLFGAWHSARDPAAAREVFVKLAQAFSHAASSDIELIAADVSGDLAYTVHREITSTTVNGKPRHYVLRVTQVYRREDGDWKVVHRHADEEQLADNGP